MISRYFFITKPDKLKEKSVVESLHTQITSSAQIVGDLSKIVKFLLVDLREPEEFEEFRIKESINMPYYQISRDKYPNDMYMMKNQTDKMIICYGLDERSSTASCQLLFQKGFDNIYMLTGGIEEFVKSYAEYCEGNGIAKILIEQKEKELKEKELLSKPRYKKSETKSIVSSSDISISNKGLLENQEYKTSSKVSTVSVSNISTSKKSEVNIDKLKKDLFKK